MSRHQQQDNPFDDDANTSHYNDYENPPPNRHPGFGNGGYSVASVSSYLPNPPSPDTVSPEEHPGLPQLNSYHQFQAQRQQDLRNLEATAHYGRPASSPQQGSRRMSAYRQQRQAAATQTQREVSPGVPQKQRMTPVQSQVGDVPRDIPPLPAHTRLDYNQRQGIAYEQPESLSVSPPDAFGVGLGMAAIADSATAAMVRGTLPYRDESPQRASAPSNNSRQAPPYQDRAFLSAPANTRPQQLSTSSRTGLTSGAAALGMTTLGRRGSDALSSAGENRGPSPRRSEYGYSADQYSLYAPSLETPSRAVFGTIDPMEIADDDDDPFAPIHPRKAAAGGAAGNVFAGFGRDAGGSYGQLGANGTTGVEKSAWLARQTSGKQRWKWIIGGIIASIVMLGVAGGVIGSLLSNKSSSSSSPTTDDGTTLTKSSSAIKALLNNANLHKVFPGIDYTPYNAQYPDCLAVPPSQNNITKDIAVLSQLTPIIRLYGTDCNQTELVLTALDLLDVKSSMQIYIGVWLSSNTSTNARQLAQMYDVLSKYGTDNVAGALIGNEVLYRADMTEIDLIATIKDVKSNFTSLGYTALKIGTADLGSEWTTSLAEAVDIVGANVHPFFGGLTAANAADWTWAYWQEHDVAVTSGLNGKTNVVAETGWPTSGGYDGGSTAGVTELNTFLEGWVCDALSNGTQYWWFEAFDEPWKSIYDDSTATDGTIETHWGLMDVDRNLKSGVTIPDCGGNTVK